MQSNRLQDPQEREYINNDKYFQQIFEVPRMKFTEIPHRLQGLLAPPDPIIIHHLIKSVSLSVPVLSVAVRVSLVVGLFVLYIHVHE